MPTKHKYCDNQYIAIGQKCRETKCLTCDCYDSDRLLYVKKINLKKRKVQLTGGGLQGGEKWIG